MMNSRASATRLVVYVCLQIAQRHVRVPYSDAPAWAYQEALAAGRVTSQALECSSSPNTEPACLALDVVGESSWTPPPQPATASSLDSAQPAYKVAGSANSHGSLAAMLERFGMPGSRETSHHGTLASPLSGGVAGGGLSGNLEGSVHSTGTVSGLPPHMRLNPSQQLQQQQQQQQPSSLKSSQTDLVVGGQQPEAAPHGGSALMSPFGMGHMSQPLASHPSSQSFHPGMLSLGVEEGSVPSGLHKPYAPQGQSDLGHAHKVQKLGSKSPDLVSKEQSIRDVIMAEVGLPRLPMSVIEARARALINSSSRTKGGPQQHRNHKGGAHKAPKAGAPDGSDSDESGSASNICPCLFRPALIHSYTRVRAGGLAQVAAIQANPAAAPSALLPNLPPQLQQQILRSLGSNPAFQQQLQHQHPRNTAHGPHTAPAATLPNKPRGSMPVPISPHPSFPACTQPPLTWEGNMGGLLAGASSWSQPSLPTGPSSWSHPNLLAAQEESRHGGGIAASTHGGSLYLESLGGASTRGDPSAHSRGGAGDRSVHGTEGSTHGGNSAALWGGGGGGEAGSTHAGSTLYERSTHGGSLFGDGGSVHGGSAMLEATEAEPEGGCLATELLASLDQDQGDMLGGENGCGGGGMGAAEGSLHGGSFFGGMGMERLDDHKLQASSFQLPPPEAQNEASLPGLAMTPGMGGGMREVGGEPQQSSLITDEDLEALCVGMEDPAQGPNAAGHENPGYNNDVFADQQVCSMLDALLDDQM
ncbi:hypothetical protein DUNSADRAFT_17982 [Dunaliella salina]|uniref:Uncharacterized protein n=1 Tax=Dunaliella salina TaxID=3046 RepID=A0ABQ7G0W7_DUNSA|nr:hypothetical protein DUNSADRAFT_17982 [Dunaliella salina]|eukprot:KAF5828243.1 hypothetical protein DUNSADRAFT_17982 [Dunaliella salina]